MNSQVVAFVFSWRLSLLLSISTKITDAFGCGAGFQPVVVETHRLEAYATYSRLDASQIHANKIFVCRGRDPRLRALMRT